MATVLACQCHWQCGQILTLLLNVLLMKPKWIWKECLPWYVGALRTPLRKMNASSTTIWNKEVFTGISYFSMNLSFYNWIRIENKPSWLSSLFRANTIITLFGSPTEFFLNLDWYQLFPFCQIKIGLNWILRILLTLILILLIYN